MDIRLHDEDRQRLGCQEWLPCDLSRMSNVEAMALEEDGGVTQEQWRTMLRGYPVFEDGKPVQVDGEQAWRHTARLWHTAVWLALNRSGVAVKYNDLVYEHLALSYRAGEAEDDGGKDNPAPEPDGESSEA